MLDLIAMPGASCGAGLTNLIDLIMAWRRPLALELWVWGAGAASGFPHGSGLSRNQYANLSQSKMDAITLQRYSVVKR
ncbi:MAG: hypothetical protein PsegKO_24210 [Pseudohongiellaceae bacterium]